MVTLGEVLTGAPWTGVSVNANSEAECSDTIIKGVKDWITAYETSLAMSCTMVVLAGRGGGGGGGARHVDCPVGVGRVVGAVESAHTRLTRGPELHVTLLDRDERGIILRV